jgi:hypothetical protein
MNARASLPHAGPSCKTAVGCALAVGLALGLGGCASGGGGGSTFTDSEGGLVQVMTGDGEVWQIRREADRRTVPQVSVTPEEAWRVLPLVYEMAGIELTTILPEERRLGNRSHRFQREIMNRRASDYFECGTDPGLLRPLADQSPIDARVETQVVAVSGGAEIRTVVAGTARRTGGSAGRANCESTGLLEVIIARLTEEFAAGTGG